ncbi:MAG TPA: SDR family oxidoreductase [Bryobacteraceae bacterium]|jgi:3-oxoacyl-[acyl-carrier protein] reductase
MLLQSKVAVITGSATGIGQGIAQLFSEEGAAVLMLDRNEEQNRIAAEKILAGGARALALAVDVRDRASIRRAVERAQNELGPVDILVNNAGIFPRQPFLTMTSEQWDEMQDVNAKSIFHTTQAVLPQMIARKSGKIVNISSVTFHLGTGKMAHYVASKGAVIGLTRALSRDFGEYNIHINCITPGAIRTESEKHFVSADDEREFLAHQSIKRRLGPLDIARACLFLSCELSDGMTGQSLNVDGGWYMH